MFGLEMEWPHVILGLIYLLLIIMLHSAANFSRGLTWGQSWQKLKDRFTSPR